MSKEEEVNLTTGTLKICIINLKCVTKQMNVGTIQWYKWYKWYQGMLIHTSFPTHMLYSRMLWLLQII